MKKDENLEILSMAGGCNTCHCEGVRKHDCGNPEKIIGNPTKQTGLPRSLSFASNDSKAAFTLSCKSFRSRLLRALLPQSHCKTLANQVSQVSLAHTSHSLRMQAHTKSKDFGSLCNSYGFSQLYMSNN